MLISAFCVAPNEPCCRTMLRSALCIAPNPKEPCRSKMTSLVVSRRELCKPRTWASR